MTEAIKFITPLFSKIRWSIPNILFLCALVGMFLALYLSPKGNIEPNLQATPPSENAQPSTLSIAKDEILKAPTQAVVATDVTSGMRQTFNEDFNTFSRYVDANGNVTCKSGGKGIWQTVYNFCYRTQPHNREEEVYIDPGFLAHLKKQSAASSETDPENPFSISNSVLTIKAAPSSAQILQAVGPWAKYTSGLITTQFSFSQTYGYFEMRAKLPAGKGLWPAFWMLPIDETWPPEIDILETFGDVGVTGEGGRTLIHYASHTPNKKDSCGAWHDLGVDLTKDFHVYGVHIEADKITYYFDRKPYATCQANPNTNKPFYMLINLAVGGWPGSPDATTPWPAHMYIDYVRAYQKI